VIADFFSEPVKGQSEHPFLLLDSGAFSAYSVGQKINADALIAYAKLTGDYLLAAINLDQIPGTLHRRAPEGEIRKACRLSHRAFKQMLDCGVRVMPVHHQIDPRRWLYRLIDEGNTFIGVSPTDSYRLLRSV